LIEVANVIHQGRLTTDDVGAMVLTRNNTEATQASDLMSLESLVRAAWHGGERDSGRFTGWLAEWTPTRREAASRA
jgi:hypothetical protein